MQKCQLTSFMFLLLSFKLIPGQCSLPVPLENIKKSVGFFNLRSIYVRNNSVKRLLSPINQMITFSDNEENTCTFYVSIEMLLKTHPRI